MRHGLEVQSRGNGGNALDVNGRIPTITSPQWMNLPRSQHVERSVILTGIKRQGAYGEAYVRLIVQAAGFVIGSFSQDSGHKVDWFVAGAGADNTTRDPRLEIQVKSTIQRRLSSGDCSYDVDRALYDWARKPKELLDVPRVIVLVRVPEDSDAWVTMSDDELVTRHCAYWVSLRGHPELPPEQKELSISFPSAQKFDLTGLMQLMTGIRRGDWP